MVYLVSDTLYKVSDAMYLIILLFISCLVYNTLDYFVSEKKVCIVSFYVIILFKGFGS